MRWITWDVRPWFCGDEVSGIVIATEDVTARVEAQNALHEGRNGPIRSFGWPTSALWIMTTAPGKCTGRRS